VRLGSSKGAKEEENMKKDFFHISYLFIVCQEKNKEGVKTMAKAKFIIFDKTEGVIESWLKDSFTFTVLALCIYISRGNSWWTFFTGFFFILLVFGKLMSFFVHKSETFSNKKDLLEYVNNLEE
jgi:hypothetical protein